jgi:hypothetical protein
MYGQNGSYMYLLIIHHILSDIYGGWELILNSGARVFIQNQFGNFSDGIQWNMNKVFIIGQIPLDIYSGI